MDDSISRQAAIDAIKAEPINGWVKDHLIGEIDALPSAQPVQYGWVCPVCGRGLSPLTMVCPCNNGKGWEITCKT